jgi:predicted ATPase/DNA-binding SARP family transcriptional activator
MEALFRIEMLGRFAVQQGNRQITRFRTQKTASLLACLALSRSRSHAREALIERFWPDSELAAARTNLSVALNALRRQLEPPGVPAGAVLIADQSQVRLNPIAFSTDVEEFENALRSAELETDAAKRAAAWVAAVDRYHGDLLPGYYNDWVLAERDRLRDRYVAALRRTVKEWAALHQPWHAIEYARRLVQADPLNEESHRILMRLLVAVGRTHDAVRQYHELEHLLKEELDVAPDAATRQLAAQLSNVPPAQRKVLEADAIGGLGGETQPESESSRSVTPLPIRRIPLQFTRFFGREEETAGLGRQLHPDSSPPRRLVTLTGPGGTGKTRLSIEVAVQLCDAFPGGVWFVPLAELHDPLNLGEAIRDVLELPRRMDLAALEQVIGYLSGRAGPSLVILDNFEQMADGAAPIVWTLLNRVPLLWCLITSRQPLSLPGELQIPVLPLPTPGDRDRALQNLVANPSVALFVDRAQAARPEFQITPRNAGPIAAICDKLEGIPLAIELAATRARALTPAQLLERLSERFELLASRRADKGDRHRSLWATMDWSYHLLSPDLQRLFARLSVFRGGWDLAAADAVAVTQEPGREPEAPEYRNTLDALTLLRGHSLIHAEESSTAIRFRMLETVREFAAEQLTQEEYELTERHHAAYFCRWVSGASLRGSERAAWYERFEEDFDNLRAVLAWSLRVGNDIETGLQVASSMGSFWWNRGHLSEGRRWLTRLLERPVDSQTSARSNALRVAGSVAYHQGDFQAARALLEECLAAPPVPGTERQRGLVHEMLGSIAYREGNYAQAGSHYERSLAYAREQAIPANVASALGNLANVAQSTGQFAASRSLNEQSLAMWREHKDRYGEARTLNNLGYLAQSQGQSAEARAFYEASLAIKRELADRFGICGTLQGLADVALAQGYHAEAAALMRESVALARELDARTLLVDALYALTSLAHTLGDLEVSVRALGAMEQAREEMSYPLSPVDQEGYARNQIALREILGPEAYAVVKAEGRSLSLEQALALLEETLGRRSL